MAETALAKTDDAPLTVKEIQNPVGGWATMSKVLAAKAPEMARVVNAAMTPEMLTQLTLTAMKNAKTADKILKCTGLSVAKTFMDLAMTGLSPAPQLGLVCFVPYGKDLQLQIEYRGFIALAKRSGQVSYITADTVHEGDDFTYLRGTEQFLRHVPKGEGKATHYYAVVRFKDGSTDFRVLTVKQAADHRDKFSKQFKATSRGPWADHFDAMAMKTAIRLLCKLLDLSPEMTHAARLDEYTEAGVPTIDMSKPGRFSATGGARRIEVESVPPDETRTQQEPPPRDSDAPEPASDEDGLGSDDNIPY